MNINQINELKSLIATSKNIVFFGGAGVSTESNIPDFRGANGLYAGKHKIPPEEILSASFFSKHTEQFFDFYREHMLYLDAEPNDAHKTLAKLEQNLKLNAVITQNIDGLHQAAGSKNVYEIHGSVHRNYCLSCRKNFSADFIKKSTGVPHCPNCGGIIKPDVTLYEEDLNMDIFNDATKAIANADVLIIGGTSLTVSPACTLVDFYNGENLVIINNSPTSVDNRADILIEGNISEVMKQCI